MGKWWIMVFTIKGQESFLLRFIIFFLFSSNCSLQRSPFLHLPLSSSLTPTNFMFSFTTSINLLFGLPLGLLSGSYWYIHYTFSVHLQTMSVWPLSFVSKTLNMCYPSGVLISDHIHPHHSQRKRQHFNLRYLQLYLLSFPQCQL